MDKEDLSLHLLVIEDNQGDLLLIEDFLFEKVRNPIIQEASTFQEVIQLFEETDRGYDAILLDLSLPDKSGESLLNEVLSLAKSTPVIVLTGYSDIEFGIKSLSLGISDYLLKDELTATSLFKSIVYSIERKAITSHLRESEKRYRDLFHLSPQPMFLYDLETMKFLDVNDAAIQHYGFSRQEFLSMTIREIRPPEDLPLVEKRINKLRQSNKGFTQNIVRHKKKNDEVIKVDLQSNIIEYEGRKAEVVLANDITERLNYINDIEEKNERLQEIAWIQSHVVRAPLARIMGLVHAVNDTVEDKKDQQKLVKLIMKSAQELDDIIRDIAEKADKIPLTEKKADSFQGKVSD
ncbi:MAG: PAS domain S-box protein [Anditalea sp.]